MCDEQVTIRALELYSGIGGMHYALSKMKEIEVVAAVDISPLANAVYRHNFTSTTLLEKGIEGLSVKDFDKFQFDMLLMSPPCQPFTRLGAKKDNQDPRTKSFFYLMEILKGMKSPPKYILLENVQGFEDSHTYAIFHQVLRDLSYNQQGFLISPKQIGIPNSRLRYYHLAVRKPNCFNRKWSDPDKVVNFFPSSRENEPENLKNENPVSLSQCKPLNNYLEEIGPNLNDFRIPEKILHRYLPVMDIVTPYSTNSTCFTKSYSHYAEGTGSVLDLSATNDDYPSKNRNLDDLNLRYFTPREIANLMGFPNTGFNFPSHLTNKQRYRLLGNSLNVHVVSRLINLLVKDIELLEDLPFGR